MPQSPRRSAGTVDGNNLLYHYLQKELRHRDPELFRRLAADLVATLAIWFDPSVYARFPFLARYAIRDVSYRGNRARGIEERWGTPTPHGLFADDNSLIKSIPRRLEIQTPPGGLYAHRRMGKGFVASHVWPGTAHTDPRTYSFVPNLVWLPVQLSKLSDRFGSAVQHYLQATSHAMYRTVPVSAELVPLVEEAWEKLAPPVELDDAVQAGEANLFQPDERFFDGRLRTLTAVISALEAVKAGVPPQGRVVSTRFRDGLPAVHQRARRKLLRDLTRFRQALGT